jgi:hypothetical protein
MRFFSSFPGMRRFAPGFAFVAIALILMAPLAACGGSSSGSSTSTGPLSPRHFFLQARDGRKTYLFGRRR